MIIKLHFFYCFLAHFLLESVVCWFIRSIKFSNYPGARHITTKKKRKKSSDKWQIPKQQPLFQSSILHLLKSLKAKRQSVLTKRRFDINKTPFYSEQNEEFENQLSARRQLLRFMLFCKLHKKRGETRKFRPLIEEILFINCLLNNQLLCVYWSSVYHSDVINAACKVLNR